MLENSPKNLKASTIQLTLEQSLYIQPYFLTWIDFDTQFGLVQNVSAKREYK